MCQTTFILLGVILSAQICLSGPVSDGEPDPCKVLEKKKLHVVKELKSWHKAYKYCKDNGWRLATVFNEQENDDLLAEIRKISKNNNNQKGFWLGGTELTHVDEWKWMDTSCGFNYTNWNRGEPNSYREREHCLNVWCDDLHWNDFDCEETQNFVCEEYIKERPVITWSRTRPEIHLEENSFGPVISSISPPQEMTSENNTGIGSSVIYFVLSLILVVTVIALVKIYGRQHLERVMSYDRHRVIENDEVY